MTDLDELSRTIGSIENQLKTAESHHHRVSASIKDLTGEIRAVRGEVNVMKHIVNEMEPEVETLRTLRNRGIGILIGVALASGSISVAVSKAIDALVHAPGG